jgi:hypothetical protein
MSANDPGAVMRRTGYSITSSAGPNRVGGI